MSAVARIYIASGTSSRYNRQPVQLWLSSFGKIQTTELQLYVANQSCFGCAMHCTSTGIVEAICLLGGRPMDKSGCNA